MTAKARISADKYRREHDAETVARAARWIDGVGGPDMISPEHLARRVVAARDAGEGLTTTGYDSRIVPVWAQVITRGRL